MSGLYSRYEAKQNLKLQHWNAEGQTALSVALVMFTHTQLYFSIIAQI